VYFVSETALVELRADECEPLMAGQQNRMFEKHFSEINKVRAERRKLMEEVALLKAWLHTQGLTLVHFSAQRKRFLRDRGYI